MIATHLMMIASSYHFRKMHRQQKGENDAKKIQNRGGGSQAGKASNVNRFRAEYDKLLKDNYSGKNPIYSATYTFQEVLPDALLLI
jgi:hypothetical protein